MGLIRNFSGIFPECGTDEAGRGCLAGPVVAAAVIFPPNYQHNLLNDSKKLSAKQREYLQPIIQTEALAWGIGVVDNTEIDSINILNASILAMHRAIDSLKIKPAFIISDGNRFKPYADIPHQTIVKGDSKYLAIAAASVLAKTHRDMLMLELHDAFDAYGWDKNKAYPTIEHRQAIQQHGTSPYHRQSFNLLGDPDFYEKKKYLLKQPKSGLLELF